MNSFYKRLKYKSFKKEALKMIPDAPGVYLFFDKNLKNIYIGKAKSLKNRLRSYFYSNLYPKTDHLIKNTRFFSFIKVLSELEAIFLEAKLIKKYKPYYNIALKDDKGPLYIFITNDKYPRLIFSRKNVYHEKYLYIFGPFINSRKVKTIISSLRKFIPYSTHLATKNKCIYSQMGLCNPCPSEIENTIDNTKKNILMKAYSQNIKNLKTFLNGDFRILENYYKNMMMDYAKNNNFEMAQLYKNKLQQFSELITPDNDPDLYTEDPYLESKRIANELTSFNNILKNNDIKTKLSRIECYDISHIHGTSAAGSMVTFINGYHKKNLYRHFRLKKSVNNDIKSLNEIGSRRIKHFSDWGTPDLIIVDGGKSQVSSFYLIFNQHNIPVVGISKHFEKLVIPHNNGKMNEVILTGDILNIVSRIRNEAHRFALKYHHKIIEKSLL
jgi:excinuclease ABC subunit C